MREELLKMLTLLVFFHRNLHAETLRLSGKRGISYQRFIILYCIKLFPACSIKEIARLVGISSSNLSLMINCLEEEGLVGRNDSPGDRRRVVLELTPTGADLLEGIEEQVVGKLQNWVGRIKREDRLRLEKAIETVVQIFLENPVSPKGGISLPAARS